MRKVTANKRRIIFINRYFYPDHSATSQILSDLAFYLSAQGFNIEIITSRQKYDDPEAELDGVDVVNGVKVNRIKTTRFGRQNLFGRSIDYLSFYLSAAFYLLFNLNSSDVVVAKTDPPMISVIAAFATKVKGAVLINWVQDLFPEVAQALGVKGLSFLYPLLLKVRNYSLKKAYKNVVIGDKMAIRLQSEGIDENNIKVIHNWSIEENIKPIDRKHNQLRKNWNIQDKFVVGYSGNIGRAHDFSALLSAAKALKSNDKIVFLIIGGGAQFNNIQKTVKELNLSNILFEPYQPRDILYLSLTVPDLHVISLMPELEGLIVPSKFYGIAASGRPVLYIGNKTGEIPKILEEAGFGKTFQINEVNKIVKYIEELSIDADLSDKMGMSARHVFNNRFEKHKAFESWLDVLKEFKT